MRFELNGDDASLPEALAEESLLWVLRDHFGVVGPKFGCGIGVCGACTVHVDGRAERSCLLAAGDVAERRVVTLEGLGAVHSDGLHPVQQAWLSERVPQCGYCQNGQIILADTHTPIALVGLLAGYSDPSHFSREFKKRLGFGPSQYLRIKTDGGRG